MRRVFITLAMFLNNVTRFYHFGDVFKQSITLDGCCLDNRLFVWTIVFSFGRSFGRCFETMQRVSITLAMFLNNATGFYHFGDVFKQSITSDGCRLDDRLFVWTIVCSFG